MRLRTFLLVTLAVLAAWSVSCAGQISRGEVDRYLTEGMRLYNAGDYMGAKDAYRKAWFVAAESSGYRKVILLNLGVVYMKTGSHQEAKEVFQEILVMDPGYKPAQLNLGLLLEREKTKEEMKEYWMRAFEIDPDKIIEQRKPKDAIILQSVDDSSAFETQSSE